MASRNSSKENQPAPAGKSPANRLELLAELRGLIDQARNRVAIAVNAELTMLYWRVGNRIRQEVLRVARAEYGKKILPALSAKLSWSHFRQLISIEDPLKRDFYAEMCRVEGWSTRTLRNKIDSMLYERFFRP